MLASAAIACSPGGGHVTTVAGQTAPPYITPTPCTMPRRGPGAAMWCSVPLAPGVVWRYSYRPLPDVPLVNVVEVDPERVVVRAVESVRAPRGYERVDEMARRTGALVAINGGFFDNTGTPPPFRFQSMLRLHGATIAHNLVPRPAVGLRGPPAHPVGFGIDPPPSPGGASLNGFKDAVGAGPFVVVPNPKPSAGIPSWTASPGGFDWSCSAHPRSAVWVLKDGRIVLGAFDGYDDASGFWLDAPGSSYCGNVAPTGWNGESLGAFILEQYPDTVRAMNLDGGGSTTFVVRGIVRNEQHNGPLPRSVIDGIVVFAGPAAASAVSP
ncbi:MAG TPA: phosphodiester glycosidase family protein [Candidatus Limnocylindrales bacterium]|nr:phosphodiester glycosidase family protein [Candidatus Limnocylindrales bacterium]